ncbi:MAG: 50S ribosomal protein L33 [Patescibacteria group bacterium]
MSQEHLIKLVSSGDEKGTGKGHTYYSRKNKKSVERKLEFKKYNPLLRKHTVYKEKKA